MKKNILLWSYGIDLPLCVSYYIQKKIDANIFIILDVTNKPKKFFKEQEIIKFTKMWFYHENIKHDYKINDRNFLEEFDFNILNNVLINLLYILIKVNNFDLLYNSIEEGWTVKKKNESYVFSKPHEGKKEVLEESYLHKFMKTNLDFNKIIFSILLSLINLLIILL